MKRSHAKTRLGVLGCGAIGSRIAKSVTKELKGLCELTALYDRNPERAETLARELRKPGICKASLETLIKSCDLMVEAVSQKNTRPLIRQALEAGRSVLAMSTGKLLHAQNLFTIAAQHRCFLLAPSGAVAGIDAVKAASLVGISSFTLTTRKPPAGFSGNPYIEKKGINLEKLSGETVLFDGAVSEAVELFPQNINVAATLALAAQGKAPLKIRILTSPAYTLNSHEVEIVGDFGRMTCRTENVVCPDNPKTSYLAVLSGIQTIRDFCRGVRVGT